MGLMADRAAGRMQARQTYRTMSRMQRRRSYVEDRIGVREDFSSSFPSRLRARLRERPRTARPA